MFEDGGGQIGDGEDGEQGGARGNFSITAKLERALRQRALDQIFGKLKRSGSGNHRTGKSGRGDEHTGDFREYRYGDALENISMTESLKNAQVNHGVDSFFPTSQEKTQSAKLDGLGSGFFGKSQLEGSKNFSPNAFF